MMRYFLDNGADAITDGPFAEAFKSRVRTALNAFIEYKKKHPEVAEDLQEQIDRALRYSAGEGDLKWVSLLLWGGANPRSLDFVRTANTGFAAVGAVYLSCREFTDSCQSDQISNSV
jgi:hypothetical protein